MKRVGNKPGQLVRSASRRRKAASRFQFDISIDKVFGVKLGATYLVKWTRGVKVAQTKPHIATKESVTKAGLAFNEKLSLLVTLYRDDNRKFDPKDSKISLVSVTPKKQERTVAKLHFDLSQFAGVPHASNTKVFKLSEKVAIRATVESRFLKAGGGGSGSAGTSSVLSGVSARSSDDELEDDFDDLALDDVPESDSVSKSKATTSIHKQPSNGPSPRVPLVAETPRSVSSLSSERPKQPTTSPSSSSITSGESPPPRSMLKSKATISVPKQALNGPSSRVPLLVETPRSSSSLSSERTKPPKTATLSSGSVTSGESPRLRSARARPSPISSADVNAFAKIESEKQLPSFRRENERLSADLARYKAERSSLEASHRRQLEELNSQLERRTKEKDSVEEELTRRTTNIASVAELRESNLNLEKKVKALQGEVDTVKRNRDELSMQYRKSSAATEEKCKQLSQEVDRLVVAVAAQGGSPDQRGSSEIEKRMHVLREEKEKLERKVKSHETHAAKTRTAYQKLTGMYNAIREQHVALLQEMDELKVGKSALPSSERTRARSERDDMSSQLEEARQEIRDVKASKDALQSDYDRLLYQIDSVQDRLERVSQELEQVRRENDELHVEAEELKGQRDMAMQRALSKGKGSSSNGESTRSIGKVEEELRMTKDKLEREHMRLSRRNEELESEIRDLKEDIDYEKSEKTKAREERDKLRESARALEQRTSLAAKQNDAMQSMRRQLSTHQMKEQNHETTISSLQREITSLRGELEEARNGASLVKSSSRDDNIGDVLQDLVCTKLALAQAEDEKLNLQFAMKTLKKSEKSIQEKLAAHASRLEVKLGQANEELERLRKSRGLEDATEFNDLGSDVDY